MLYFMDDRSAHGAYYSIGGDMRPMFPLNRLGL